MRPEPLAGETKEAFHRKVCLRQYAYETLLEMALNFYGLESRWLDQREKEESLGYIHRMS